MKRRFLPIACAVVVLFFIPIKGRAAEFLIPVGRIIGLHLSDDTVTVTAFDDVLGGCSRDAGLQIGDQLLTVDSLPIRSPRDVQQALAACDADVDVTVRRGSRTHSLRILPRDTKDGKKLGIYLRQGISGVGTVTWYDPESGAFGALGHGVSTPKGGLLDMRSGNAYPAEVVSVIRGKSGEPGQLKGSADAAAPWGTLFRNTPQGVFGISPVGWRGQSMPVADFEDVRTGPATIRSTIQGSGVQEYSVEILKIYPEERADNRNFLLKITDTDLLNATGGIVQGMGLRDIRDNTRNA